MVHFPNKSGPDGTYHTAEAGISPENSSVVEVETGNAAVPVRIRYAWDDCPLDANLYNSEGLPALPFQIEVDDPKVFDNSRHMC